MCLLKNFSMIFLYTFFTTLFYPILFVLPFFSKQAREFLDKRKQSLKNLKKFHKKNDSPLYWLHASSVGELEQCKAIAKVIKAQEPNSQIVQSVFSISVNDKHLTSDLFDFSFYLPLDFFWSYEPYFRIFRPKTLVLTAWDSWLHLLLTAKRYNTKTYLVCASIHENSGRLSFFGKILSRIIFSYLDGLMPSSQILIPHFQKIIDKSKIGPPADSRFDSVIDKIQLRNQKPFLPKAQKIIIFASTYKQDEEVFFSLINNFPIEGFSIWIFPHKVNLENIQRIEKKLKSMNLHYLLYSSLLENPDLHEKICLFDKVGILAYAYEFGFYTYVGGGMHHRVHNVIEPAYFGLPIITGPKITHSAEALDLKSNQGLFVVHDKLEFTEIHLKLTQDKDLYKEIKEKNSQYVLSRKGESKKIYEYIKN